MSRHIYENEMRSIRSSQVYLLIDRGTNKWKSVRYRLLNIFLN
jgi:hypothetical protein